MRLVLMELFPISFRQRILSVENEKKINRATESEQIACQKNKTVNSVQIKLKIFLLESDTGHAVNFFRITVFA